MLRNVLGVLDMPFRKVLGVPHQRKTPPLVALQIFCKIICISSIILILNYKNLTEDNFSLLFINKQERKIIIDTNRFLDIIEIRFTFLNMETWWYITPLASQLIRQQVGGFFFDVGLLRPCKNACRGRRGRCKARLGHCIACLGRCKACQIGRAHV